MRNEFTAVIERDGKWFIAYCPEIPGGNGQGRTKEEARDNLAEAIRLILEDRREDGLRGVPPEAARGAVNQSSRAVSKRRFRTIWTPATVVTTALATPSK